VNFSASFLLVVCVSDLSEKLVDHGDAVMIVASLRCHCDRVWPAVVSHVCVRRTCLTVFLLTYLVYLRPFHDSKDSSIQTFWDTEYISWKCSNKSTTGLSLNNFSRSRSSRDDCWVLSVKCNIDNRIWNRFRLITEPNSGKGSLTSIELFQYAHRQQKSQKFFILNTVKFWSRIRERVPTIQWGSNRKE